MNVGIFHYVENMPLPCAQYNHEQKPLSYWAMYRKCSKKLTVCFKLHHFYWTWFTKISSVANQNLIPSTVFTDRSSGSIFGKAMWKKKSLWKGIKRHGKLGNSRSPVCLGHHRGVFLSLRTRMLRASSSEVTAGIGGSSAHGWYRCVWGGMWFGCSANEPQLYIGARSNFSFFSNGGSRHLSGITKVSLFPVSWQQMC